MGTSCSLDTVSIHCDELCLDYIPKREETSLDLVDLLTTKVKIDLFL